MLRGRGQRGRQKSKHTILVAHCSGILEYLQQDPNFSHHSKPLTNLSKLLKEVDFEDMASRYPFPVSFIGIHSLFGTENSRKKYL